MITDERLFELAIGEEKRNSTLAAKSYGSDAAKLMLGDFKPDLSALYARIAAHFGRRVLLALEKAGGRS